MLCWRVRLGADTMWSTLCHRSNAYPIYQRDTSDKRRRDVYINEKYVNCFVVQVVAIVFDFYHLFFFLCSFVLILTSNKVVLRLTIPVVCNTVCKDVLHVLALERPWFFSIPFCNSMGVLHAAALHMMQIHSIDSCSLCFTII